MDKKKCTDKNRYLQGKDEKHVKYQTKITQIYNWVLASSYISSLE